jgi:hypothetical protein
MKSLEVCSDCTPRTTKVLKAVMLGMTDKHKEKNKQETIVSGLCETSIHLVLCIHESKRKTKIHNYHHYTLKVPLCRLEGVNRRF